LDKCPKELLEYMAYFLGVEFPFAMDEATQRKFLKVMPSLYKIKGMEDSFNYLAREIFGSTSGVETTKQVYEEGMPPEEWRKIFVKVYVDGEQGGLNLKIDQFDKFIDYIRPVNRYIITQIISTFMDSYDTKNRAADDYFKDMTIFVDTMLDTLVLNVNEAVLERLIELFEETRYNNYSEAYTLDKATVTDTEAAGAVLELFSSEKITVNVETETVNASTEASMTSKGINVVYPAKFSNVNAKTNSMRYSHIDLGTVNY
jgi:hypothetical protein